MINEEVEHIIEAELREGEELLWADKPEKRPITGIGILRGGVHIFVMVFTGYWLLAVTFSEAASLTLKILFILFGLFFAAFAIGMRKQPFKHLFGPAHEIYAITNKRAIIISPYWRLERVDLSSDDMVDFFIKGNDELGTIIFPKIKIPVFVYAGHKKYWDAFDTWQKSDLGAFHKIKNPYEVKNLIHQTFGSIGTPS